MSLLKTFLGILIAEDEAANVALGSVDGVSAAANPHYTLSQRWAFERQKGNKQACVICKLLTIIFKPFNPSIKNYDHCSQAISGFSDNLPTDG